MLLGWSPKDDREIIPKDVIENEFKLENINVAPAIFDEKKLLWMNGEYIRNTELSKLKSQILDYDPALNSIEHFDEYLELAQTRMKTLKDFRSLVINDSQTALSSDQKKLAKKLFEGYEKINDWRRDKILEVSFQVRDELKCTTQDLYLVLTGKAQGLPLGEKLEIEGKKKTLLILESLNK